MGVRRNILEDRTARDDYIRGIKILKEEYPGVTTRMLRIPGPVNRVSTYDLFTVWHHVAMTTFTPPGQTERNAAHRGPVFLPWHRYMLLQLEMNLQRVLNDENFGLPYWDWAADGELPIGDQRTALIWADDCMGGNGNPVTTGPFAFDSDDDNSWRVRIQTDINGRLEQTDRGLIRDLAGFTGAPDLEPNVLPTKEHTAIALQKDVYDESPWDTNSRGFRNCLEGWEDNRPQIPIISLHNRVHVFVAGANGDMGPTTSPNDPIFYLNHCNVDRIWEAWMQPHGRVYLPRQTAPASLRGHRLNDTITSFVAAATTPARMLNVTRLYTYDSLLV